MDMMESLTLSDDKRTVTFTHSFQPWDFNRAGVVPVWTMSDRGAWLVYMSFFIASPEVSRLSGFVRSHAWDVDPSFYTLSPGQRFKVRSSMTNIGTTSFAMSGEFVDISTNQVLVKGRTINIHIDLDTRRPKPIPDWVKKHYSYPTSQPRPTTVEAFEKPPSSKSFINTVTVLPSDIDQYNHTNQSHYLRYCFNSAAVGARKGAFPTIKGDFLKYRVWKAAVLYQRESLEGDVLTVESWEDSRDTLRFHVKKGSENVVQVTLQFYMPPAYKTEQSKL